MVRRDAACCASTCSFADLISVWAYASMSISSTLSPSGFDPGLERRAEFVGILCRKVDLVGHSVGSERNRSDVPRHDIAAQVADGRLEAKPSRVLSYKDIREAHHILEAAEAGKEW